MTFLFNVIFRILHMLMVLLPSQSAFKIWLRQMAEDALLMEHVTAGCRSSLITTTTPCVTAVTCGRTSCGEITFGHGVTA